MKKGEGKKKKKKDNYVAADILLWWQCTCDTKEDPPFMKAFKSVQKLQQSSRLLLYCNWIYILYIRVFKKLLSCGRLCACSTSSSPASPCKV